MQAAFPFPKGYTSDVDARFLRLDAEIEREEGGLSDDPADHGGLTNRGVTLRFLVACGRLDPIVVKAYDLDHSGDLDGADIRLLTADQVRALFRQFLWIRTGFWKLPQPLDGCLLDQAVNCGQGFAVRLLQMAINKLNLRATVVVDGVNGDQTRMGMSVAITVFGIGRLVQAYREAAIDHYRAICQADPAQMKYLAGWQARAEALGHV